MTPTPDRVELEGLKDGRHTLKSLQALSWIAHDEGICMPADNGRFLWLWFLLTALSVAFMAYEQLRPGHGKASRIKKLSWLLYTLYTGPFSLLVYWWSGRAIGSSPRERAAEATVHCAAGQMTGMLLAAMIARALRLGNGDELVAEYLGGLVVGLLMFKALGRPTGSIAIQNGLQRLLNALGGLSDGSRLVGSVDHPARVVEVLASVAHVVAQLLAGEGAFFHT